MALLSQMFRTVAITGRTDTVNAWFASRQGGRWAEQTVQAAFANLPSGDQPVPHAAAAPAPVDTAETLRQLTELHRQGVVDDSEFETLRARLRAEG